jgi:hypothetical protein
LGYLQCHAPASLETVRTGNVVSPQTNCK